MTYLIDSSERAVEVIEALRETHRYRNGILAVREEDYGFNIYNLVEDCKYNHIILIITTDSIEMLRRPEYNMCCIFPDGSGKYEKRSRTGDLVIEPNKRISI